MEQYHQARIQGEFPGFRTISLAINGGVLAGLIHPLATIPGMLLAGGVGYLWDRKAGKQAMKKFIQEQELPHDSTS